MKFSHQVLKYNDTRKNTILDYQVEIYPLKPEDRTYIWLNIGNYSLTGFEMKLTRNYMKYLFNYYLPSGLFVIVSWSSFLIPPEIVPGRMTLLVTLFLVLINIFNNITITSPNTETMTALSAWMIACILFVFGALASYAGILFAKYMRFKVVPVLRPATNGVSSNAGDTLRRTMMPYIENGNETLKQTDQLLLIIFPALFVSFNCAYWPFFI